MQFNIHNCSNLSPVAQTHTKTIIIIRNNAMKTNLICNDIIIEMYLICQHARYTKNTIQQQSALNVLHAFTSSIVMHTPKCSRECIGIAIGIQKCCAEQFFSVKLFASKHRRKHAHKNSFVWASVCVWSIRKCKCKQFCGDIAWSFRLNSV